MAVGGDPESRHGIVLAKDQLAKKAGVKTGMALWEARNLCPDIVFVPPNLDLYMRFSRMAHEIYGEYTQQQEAFGIDESWLDVTASAGCCGSGMAIAEEIRSRIKKEMGVTVSIGVSWNKIFAKFGSDYKKPDAVTAVTHDNYKRIVWPQKVGDLLFVGRATQAKLYRHGIFTIGQLAGTDPAFLQSLFGKMGLVLYLFANGQDQTPVNVENAQSPIKSIGNGITAPRDLSGDEEVGLIVEMLSESVSRRMRENHFKCRLVEFYGCDNTLNGFGKQHKIKRATNISGEIAAEAMRLFHQCCHTQNPLRNVSVRAGDLVRADAPEQMDLCVDENKRMKLEKMDEMMTDIRDRFGYNSIEKGKMLLNESLTRQAALKDHEVHPHGYFEGGNRTGVEQAFGLSS